MIRPGQAAILLTSSLVVACHFGGQESIPEPVVPQRSPEVQAGFPEELLAAERRYASGIECGTQHLFEMADLAKEAPAHIPEVVGAFRTGDGAREASTVLLLMRKRALLVVPPLLELSRHPDVTVRERATEAIQTAFAAADIPETGCGSTPERERGTPQKN